MTQSEPRRDDIVTREENRPAKEDRPWLTICTFLLGVIETTLYGAGAGLLYTAVYNYFARRAERGNEQAGMS